MRGSSTYDTRRRRPALTARLRLTLLYTGMFLILGTAAFALTFLLTSHSAAISGSPARSVGEVNAVAG